MPNYFDAREILAERWRNRRSKRIPWVPGQRLGLAIPTGWHLRLYLECERRGIRFSPKIFRLKEDETPAREKKQDRISVPNVNRDRRAHA